MRSYLTILPTLLLLFSCGKGEGSEQGNVLAAPTGITLYGKPTETSIGFKWDEVQGADSYRYRLSLGNNEVRNERITQRFVKIEKLSKGTSYSFCVAALKGGEQSEWSAPFEAKTEGVSDEMPSPLEGDVYAAFMIPAGEEDGIARAFPGAEGGGMYTTGGRGGAVYHVTSLEDNAQSPAEGTLRYGVVKGNRPLVIVFDVAGIITLADDLKITKGDLTIAGQTAPGDGICLKNYSTVVDADNVIIRFVRFRLGDKGSFSSASKADSEDAVWGRYHQNIILDHCSMSWSIDETASFYANAYFSMQWCVVAESMKSCDLHSKGDHGYGGIWGGKNASFHHNLVAHHQNRTPRFDHQYLYDGNGKSTDTFRGNVDMRNCVIYNWGSSNGCYGGEGGHFNLVGNYYKKGVDSNTKAYFIEADGGYSTTENGEKKYFPYDWAYLYLSGNYNTEYPSGSSSYPDGIYWKKAFSDYDLSYEGHVLSSALPIKGKDGKDAYTTTHDAREAMERVCANAGASLSRDAVDERICKDVKNSSGCIINDIADVESKYGLAWPEYKGEDVVDTDLDGIPDYYEALFGLDKGNSADAAKKTLDTKGRYTNLEMYLHYLVKDIVAAQNAGGTYQKL